MGLKKEGMIIFLASARGSFCGPFCLHGKFSANWRGCAISNGCALRSARRTQLLYDGQFNSSPTSIVPDRTVKIAFRILSKKEGRSLQSFFWLLHLYNDNTAYLGRVSPSILASKCAEPFYVPQ